jgi:hypothetical protein
MYNWIQGRRQNFGREDFGKKLHVKNFSQKLYKIRTNIENISNI